MIRQLWIWLLLGALLLQGAGTTLVVLDYHLRREAFVAQHCINRDLPEQTCAGKCYLSLKTDPEPEPGQGPSFPVEILRLLPALLPASPNPEMGPSADRPALYVISSRMIGEGLTYEFFHPPRSLS